MHKEKKRKMALFVTKFFLIYSVLYALILLTNTFYIEEGLAKALHYFTGKGMLEGNTIMFDGEGFQINESCTGLVSASILAALVFSLPKPEAWKKTLIVLCGALIMLAVNFFRVTGVITLGYYYGAETAEILHIASWFLTSGILLIVWYYLNKKISKVKELSELV